MLEVDFKPNSTPQNRLVRWGLHLTYIYYELALSLVNAGLPTKVKNGPLIVNMFDV